VQLARFILAKPQPDRYCDIAGTHVATRKWAEQTEETAEHLGACAGICLGHGQVAGPLRLLGRYISRFSVELGPARRGALLSSGEWYWDQWRKGSSQATDEQS